MTGSVAPGDARLVELRSLREEILVRVIFQNLLLVSCLLLLGAVLIVHWMMGRPGVSFAYSVVSVAASGMWAHHGCRTAQIRAYLMARSEPDLWGEGVRGWEAALDGMRFESLLGSRWLVSTKGFLLGSQALVIAILAIEGGRWGRAEALIAFGGLIVSAWLLHEPAIVMHAGEQDPRAGRA